MQGGMCEDSRGGVHGPEKCRGLNCRKAGRMQAEESGYLSHRRAAGRVGWGSRLEGGVRGEAKGGSGKSSVWLNRG